MALTLFLVNRSFKILNFDHGERKKSWKLIDVLKNSRRLITYKKLMCHCILCWIELNNFAELSLTPVSLLCTNQHNKLLCKSMVWFLNYSNAGLNGFKNLSSSFVIIIRHHSLLDHRLFHKSLQIFDMR